jgi:hypothetical protein
MTGINQSSKMWRLLVIVLPIFADWTFSSSHGGGSSAVTRHKYQNDLFIYLDPIYINLISL